MTADPYELDRFVAAQEAAGTFDRAAAELRAGRKSGHWMWFVFPQIAGLGRSPASRRYAISSLAEARAYLAHPVLGPRLITCAGILTRLAGVTAEQVFGDIDATKLRSCLTLFQQADPAEPAFGLVLDQYFGGQRDPLTDQAIAATGQGHDRDESAGRDEVAGQARDRDESAGQGHERDSQHR
jgi:uncharacterized protein (DUF1810 family)